MIDWLVTHPEAFVAGWILVAIATGIVVGGIAHGAAQDYEYERDRSKFIQELLEDTVPRTEAGVGDSPPPPAS